MRDVGLSAREVQHGSGIQPAMGFHMAVGKRQHAPLPVQVGWQMNPSLQGHIHAEGRRADAGRIDIREDEPIDRRVRRDL